MSKSIKELRRICQKSAEEEFHYTRWIEREERNIRRISIYFTKLFLKLGISANQVTVIGLLIGITAGAFLCFGDPRWWILGALLIFLSNILDRADGEVARYNRSASAVGTYLDSLSGGFLFIYTFGCMSFGIYNATQDSTVFIFALLGLGALFLQRHNELLGSRYFQQSDIAPMGFVTNKAAESKGRLFSVIKYGTYIFLYFIWFCTILAVALVDCFISPFTVGYMPLSLFPVLNARYLYFIIYALAMFVGVILVIYHTLKSGGKS